MKITKKQLRELIREEIQSLNEKHGKIPGFSAYANLADPFYNPNDKEEQFMAKVEVRAAELGLLDDLYKGVKKYHFPRENRPISGGHDWLELKNRYIQGVENRITKHGKMNKSHVKGMKSWIKSIMRLK